MAIRVPAAKVHFDFHARREILDRIDESLSNGSLTLGPNCARLEELAKQWTGSSIVVATNAGTSALEIALRIVNVKDRIVLVPANTFFATALAAMHAGAEVRFVDIELDGLGMDPSELRQALNQYSSVAAVILVHVGGIVAPSIHEVASLCRERGIPVIEDAAHALGSSLNGVLAGSFGDFAAFSMYPTKIVTSAEGGFLTCQSQESAQIARSLRDQGKESFAANIHSRLGYNWRMSEVHASIGIAHFERLKEFLDSRRKYAERYDALLDDCRGIRRFPLPARSQSNYYKYIAYLQSGIDRDALKVNLRKGYGVQLSGEVYEIPCCAQPYYGNTYGPEQFPRAYEFCRLHICLPVFSTLKPEQQNLTVGALSAEIGKASRVAEAF
jgi:dTDP-4-amino-4,6-dideoxygalactose transaminase